MQFAAGASALGDTEPGHEGSSAEIVLAPKTYVSKLDAERFCAAWGYRLPRVGDYSARPIQWARDPGSPKTELRGLFSKPHEWCHEAWGEVDPAKRTKMIHLFSGYEGPPIPPEDAFDVVLEGDELGTVRFCSSLPEMGWPDVGFRVVMDAEDLRRIIGGEIRR
ncbi:MAG: hypothetical protein IPN34_24255 [Planctomycetes bacterium]|nr:hypothetical protein [Planctomycetota bacterium]